MFPSPKSQDQPVIGPSVDEEVSVKLTSGQAEESMLNPALQVGGTTQEIVTNALSVLEHPARSVMVSFTL